MDCRANKDLCFLQDEKFDFDVSLSPVSSTGEEEEDDVFVGKDLSSLLEEDAGGVQEKWTPLTGDQLEAVCEEAHRLARQLQIGDSPGEDNDTTKTTSDTKISSVAECEEFTEDTEAKLGKLGHTASVLSPIKRQTFCVQDSPLKQLPPAIQRQLLRGSSSSRASSSQPAAKLSTPSPMVGPRSQSRTTLRGKPSLGAVGVLPNKPVAPTASRSASKSGLDKTRLQPPSRTTGVLRRSLSSRPNTRAESTEDLLSDSVSVASDTSDCSLNSSLLGKRKLAPPSKDAGLRKISRVKAPAVQTCRVTERRNTSSSSSSMSSLNSSISLSPAKGKLNPPLNRSLSSSTGTSSFSKEPPVLNRPRRSTICTSAEPVSSSTRSQSQSSQALKLPNGERAKIARLTPMKRAEITPIQPTPPKRMIDRPVSVGTSSSVKLQSRVKTRSNPPHHPTPNMAEKRVEHADGTKVMKPKRLSVSSTDSRPQKQSTGSSTPSVGGCKPLQVAARRPSALPTPVKSRTSTFQASSNQTQTFRLPSRTDSSLTQTPKPAEKQLSFSPAPKEQQEEPLHHPEVRPFSLEEEAPSAPQLSNSPGTKQTHSDDHGTLTVSETVPTENPTALENSTAKTQEVLLLDLPPPALQPQEKLLIDLANTPDLIRTNTKTCTTTNQLIDLSSPLIKWSPEEKKENQAPLINLSF
ncbi:PREDICTED: G2 and S phase-expressed protein 1 [Cyprinodon variegatus]|uniref:G-2 and S-phase expressed 1 n=1 Tax=Cyprinodon variegatus TaxID=28743 RepID=A0A3Q2E2B2_CYPVA|nr:PREDICTED: G2 and S phase-expressed protein 1 [Cyprinodon variegatus]